MLRLIDRVSDSSLSSFEYETEELKLSIQCGEKAVLTAAPMVSETELPRKRFRKKGGAAGRKTGQIAAGRHVLCGTFPGRSPLRKGGRFGKKGSGVGIVEAMKLMNEIESDCDGMVGEVYAENGESVEYGMPLFGIV